LKCRNDAIPSQNKAAQQSYPDALPFPEPKPDKISATDFTEARQYEKQ
jgi:hypothetical protein